jgi:type I restriction enzyme S subunit
MSDVIPSGWTKSMLGQYIGVQGGNAFKSEEFTDSGIPVIRISNIKKNGSVNLNNAIYTHGDEALTRFKVENGDILIAMSGATTGKVGRYRSNRYAYLNQRVGRFFVKNNSKTTLDFIHQITSEDDFVNSILIDAVGGAQPNISNQQIESIVVSLPPLPEQQKIAAILSSVDEVIEKTQAQINKLKDLKTGMMQELLSPREGQAANINNPQGECKNSLHHTEFKDSPLGRIPVGWEAVTLGKVTRESAFGPRFSSDYYSVDGNIGCIRTTDMDKNWDIDYTTVPLAELEHTEFESHILQQGDLLVTRSGTCGVVDVYREQLIPMVAAAFLIRFRLTETVNPWFIRYAMMSTGIQDKIQLLASGGVQKNLSGTNLKTLLLPMPNKDEQDRIVKIIDSVGDRVGIADAKLKHLNMIKKALMQDLLTGKVRVKVDAA